MIRSVSFVFAFGTLWPAARADDRFFEARVRPMLAEHCFTCHGPKKQKGDLRLDTPGSTDAVRKHLDENADRGSFSGVGLR